MDYENYIDTQLLQFKTLIESAIIAGGPKGKESIIRSSALINLIHEAVKYEFIIAGVNPQNIYPHFGDTSLVSRNFMACSTKA